MRRLSVRACLALCAYLALSAASQSDATKARDGYWWLDLSRSDKLVFVGGYVAGISRAEKLVRIYTETETLKVANGANRDLILRNFDLYEISYGQFAEGLDAFYGDFRNKRILFDYAVVYVRDQVRGVPAKELEERVERMRKAAADNKYEDQ